MPGANELFRGWRALMRVGCHRLAAACTEVCVRVDLAYEGMAGGRWPMPQMGMGNRRFCGVMSRVKHFYRSGVDWSCRSPWLTEIPQPVRAQWYTDGIPWAYIDSSSGLGRPCDHPCRKGRILSIAIISSAAAVGRLARTGGQRNMKWGRRRHAAEFIVPIHWMPT